MAGTFHPIEIVNARMCRKENRLVSVLKVQEF